MKKIIYIIIFLYPFSLNSLEKTKEEKVAKYVIENIQKDYVSCYSFYKVSAESFKKVGKDKNIIEGLEKSADVTLKFNHDLGEVLGLKLESMVKINKKEVEKFGGEYLVRNGEFKVIDGEWKHPRTVVIKFPTYEKALEWYNSEEYKPIKPIRLANSVANGIIIKGV